MHLAPPTLASPSWAGGGGALTVFELCCSPKGAGRLCSSPQENPTEAAQTDRLIGKLVSDRYRIIRKIGEGGMGTVYECMHEAIEKRIALKVLHAEYSSSAEVVHRFKQEAISASRIKHQNVIDVFDFGQLGDGSCFIAMEFLEGMDLGAALQKYGHFSPDRALRIIVQVARALGLGHARGVIHRDMKPENVFLQITPEGDESVKIVDFGIAQLRTKDELEQPVEGGQRPKRLTKTGMIFGTPEYMAPEQARGRAIDQRSDVYATGVILYELLTGAVPFLGESFLEVLNQHVQSQVPPINEVNPDVKVSPELARAVHKALEKDPDDRYPDMKAFTQRLLSTPEGRAARALTSSMSGASPVEFPDEDPSMRVESSRYPKPASTDGTAMFGSPGQEPLGDDPPVVPTHASKAGYYAGAVVLLGLAAFAAWSFSSEEPKTLVDAPAPDQPPPAATPPEEEPETPVAPVSSGEGTEKGPEASTTLQAVTLSVVTDPEGGVVFKEGFQVCDAAPCDVKVPLNDAVTLSAEKAGRKGEAKVLAQKDQTVTIKLAAPRVAPPRPASPPSPKGQLCEVMVDGIKILRPCQ